MSTSKNIERLERLLSSTFWQDDARQCVMEKLTIKIIGQQGYYRWRLDDADDGSNLKSTGEPFHSLDAAKDSLFGVLQDGLCRHREQARKGEGR